MIYIKPSSITKATLGRLPGYLKYLESLNLSDTDTVSATAIARGMGYGEIQVRKDLNSVSGTGRPKVGYLAGELTECLRQILIPRTPRQAVLVGAGSLGKAFLEYKGFANYGLEVAAAFDTDEKKLGFSRSGKEIFHISRLGKFVNEHKIRIGIIAVPEHAAQGVCDMLVSSGIEAVWSFSAQPLQVPENVIVQHENLALSLAHLSLSLEGEAE